MSQDWPNLTLDCAKFSEVSVHHPRGGDSHLCPVQESFSALFPLSHGAAPNQDVLQHRSPKCHLSPGPA